MMEHHGLHPLPFRSYGACDEAPALVAGLQNVAAVAEPTKQCGGQVLFTCFAGWFLFDLQRGERSTFREGLGGPKERFEKVLQNGPGSGFQFNGSLHPGSNLYRPFRPLELCL